MTFGFGFGFPRDVSRIAGGGAAGGPSLDLDFLQGVLNNPTQTDNSVTFSRASNATMFGPTGALEYAPHNLLTYSEQFDNAAWAKALCTVSANIVVAPNGTTTADALVEDTTNGFRAFTQNFTALGGTPYVISFIVKAGARSWVRVYAGSSGSWASAPSVIFDLSTGTVVSGANGTITPEGTDGWYRCSVAGVFGVSGGSTSAAIGPVLTGGGSNSYLGTGATALYVWGAQLNVGQLQPYYSTTVPNLLGYTQEFDNAAWVKAAGSGLNTNVTIAPDGSLTADKFSVGTSTFPQITQPATTVVATAHTGAIYVKADGLNFVQIRVRDFVAQTNFFRTVLNLQDGTITQSLAGGSGSLAGVKVEDAGNGWWRCGITGIANTSGTQLQLVIILTKDANATVATPSNSAATDGIYLWGAQLSDSASLDPYVYNPVASPTPAAYYGPRFDYNPATLALNGLLIEEQRTNSIRNNTAVGAVAGTPGTLPTNWGSVVAGLTQTVVGTGVEDGINYIDIRFNGTTTGTSLGVRFESNTGVAVASGQTWTASTFCRRVGGSTTNVASSSIGLSGLTSAGVLTTDSTSASLTPVLNMTNLETTRTSRALTFADATTAYARVQVIVSFLVGAVIDITLRIGLPQLEQGAFATSVIPTSGATATRAPDVATMVGANFSNWYNQSEGTFYANWVLGFDNAAAVVYQADDGTNLNLIRLRYGTAGATTDCAVIVGGAAQCVLGDSNQNTAGAIYKNAACYEVNNFARSADGRPVVTDTSGTLPTVSILRIASNASGVEQLNGWIQRITYYPRRLSNAELQAITA